MAFRTRDEIDEQMTKAAETEYDSRWKGMSYEMGVGAALRWATGDSDEAPIEDD